LEGMQSGLSWLTILRKRDNFRAAFAGFEPTAVAEFGDDDVERLLADAGIVRNRLKVNAAIINARAVVALQEAGGSLDQLFWSHAP
ncbi:DNA-3-methyladenine glycosylase I, partial [Demequina sp. TTPB684]